MKFLEILKRANIQHGPDHRWTEWEHSDLNDAPLLKMVIQEVIEDQVLRDDIIHWHGYDYSEMCHCCGSGVKLKDTLCLDKEVFARMAKRQKRYRYQIALSSDWHEVVQGTFKEMVERAGLTGVRCLPTRDYLGRDAKFPPVYQLEFTNVMPPALMNSDTRKCPECGRTSFGTAPFHYSKKSFADAQVCDFNWSNEWSMGTLSPELEGRAIIVKNSVYRLCHENGIGRNQIAWDVVQVD
ncbi:hypothetical protein EG832_20945 [bacterium]|nr:hypothetical protein [bacterium]